MNSTTSAHENNAASFLQGLAGVIAKNASLIDTATSAFIADTKSLPELQQACRTMIHCALVMQETLDSIQK